METARWRRRRFTKIAGGYLGGMRMQHPGAERRGEGAECPKQFRPWASFVVASAQSGNVCNTRLMSKDIRWKQRLDNYTKTLAQLSAAVTIARTRPLSLLEKQGLIKGFEFTYELAWNAMKDYFAHQANTSITGSRDAFREAFQKGLIHKGHDWMAMIESRNQTSHTYNQLIADEIAQKIMDIYFPLFCDFRDTMNELAKK